MPPLRLRRIEDLKIRNYAPRTIQIYVDRVAKFAQHFGQAPDRLGPAHSRPFQLYLVETKNALAVSTEVPVDQLLALMIVCEIQVNPDRVEPSAVMSLLGGKSTLEGSTGQLVLALP